MSTSGSKAKKILRDSGFFPHQCFTITEPTYGAGLLTGTLCKKCNEGTKSQFLFYAYPTSSQMGGKGCPGLGKCAFSLKCLITGRKLEETTEFCYGVAVCPKCQGITLVNF